MGASWFHLGLPIQQGVAELRGSKMILIHSGTWCRLPAGAAQFSTWRQHLRKPVES